MLVHFQPDFPDRLSDEVTRLLDHYRTAKQPPRVIASRHWHPLVDVFEVEDGFRIVVELAGMHEDEVEVLCDGNTVIVRGNRPAYGARMRRVFHQMEIPAGPFERVIELPVGADIDRVSARYDNGFLEILVPRRTDPQRHTVPIRTT